MTENKYKPKPHNYIVHEKFSVHNNKEKYTRNHTNDRNIFPRFG